MAAPRPRTLSRLQHSEAGSLASCPCRVAEATSPVGRSSSAAPSGFFRRYVRRMNRTSRTWPSSASTTTATTTTTTTTTTHASRRLHRNLHFRPQTPDPRRAHTLRRHLQDRISVPDRFIPDPIHQMRRLNTGAHFRLCAFWLYPQGPSSAGALPKLLYCRRNLGKWWRGRDSNPRPRDYESRALTS